MRWAQVVQKKHPMKSAGVAGRLVRAQTARIGPGGHEAGGRLLQYVPTSLRHDV